MTFQKPNWQQNLTYPANLDRQLIGVALRDAGIHGLGDYKVSQRGAGANMSVDVAAGQITVPGTDVANQGKYLCWSDAVANVVLNAAPGAGQERIDLIVVKVRDAAVIGGGINDFLVDKVTGTAAAVGTAVEPATPASSVVIGRVYVGPLVVQILDANITDRRPVAFRTPTHQQKLTGSGSGFTVTTLTDMAVNNVPVAKDHTYAIHIHTDWTLTLATVRWDLFAKVNGTDVGRLAIAESAASGTADGIVHWKAPFTQSTDDFTVNAVEVVDGATFTLFAAAAIPRALTIEDMGVITNV